MEEKAPPSPHRCFPASHYPNADALFFFSTALRNCSDCPGDFRTNRAQKHPGGDRPTISFCCSHCHPVRGRHSVLHLLFWLLWGSERKLLHGHHGEGG